MTRTPTNGNGVSLSRVSVCIKNLRIVYQILHICFYIVLTKFYINLSRQEQQIELLGLDQLLQYSGFSLYLLSLILYSPFKQFIA